MTLRIGEEKITYRLAEAMKHSLVFDDSCYFLDVNDEIANEYLQEMAQPDPYKEWPVIEEEQLHDQVACLIKNQPEGSLLK